MQEEQWKPIPGYDGYYEISNLGRVKSLNYHRTGKEGFLSIQNDGCGYSFVSLSKHNQRKYPKIHCLVAEAFIPNPNNLPQVNHIDENKSNNRVDNLEWCTPSYNTNYGTRNKRVAKKLKEQRPSKPVEQWSLDGKLIKVWPAIMDVRRHLGFCEGHIIKCCKGKAKTSYGYIWKYKEPQAS